MIDIQEVNYRSISVSNAFSKIFEVFIGSNDTWSGKFVASICFSIAVNMFYCRQLKCREDFLMKIK